MPYVLAVAAVMMPAILIVQTVRGRMRVRCCAVLPPVDHASTSQD
jgi:hypothetical protein